jgi:ATP-dependent helicase/DNAse subunit B
MERLWARYLTPDEDGKTALLSPSALNEYLRCPLSFFLSHVAEIREQEDLEDGIDARALGNIFHSAAQKMYTELIGRSGGNKTISQDQISLLLADHGRRIQPYIDEAFQKEGGVSDFQGENIILRAVVERFLLNLLRYDRTLAPFTILMMEKTFCFDLTINRNGEPVTIRTGGFIDRLDMLKDGTVRVVDYKTGGHLDKDVTMDKIFQKGDHAGYYLQTLLYSLAYIKKTAEKHKPELPVKPLLFYPAKAATDDYDPTLMLNGAPLTDLREGTLMSDYEERLQNLVKEVFDESIPFQKTDNSPCKMCPYRTICLS